LTRRKIQSSGFVAGAGGAIAGIVAGLAVVNVLQRVVPGLTAAVPGVRKIAAIAAGILSCVLVAAAVHREGRRVTYRSAVWRSITYLVLSAYLLAVVLPMTWVIMTSFKPTREIYANPVGLPRVLFEPTPERVAQMKENYVKAWVKSQFSAFFFNSLKVTGITLAAVLTFSATAAYVLARFNFPGNRLIFFYFLSGLMIPVQLVLIPLFFEIGDISEWMTQLLSPLARLMGAQTLVVNLHDTHTGLILIYIALSLPFTIFILTGFFRTIPDQLREAALIDGSSEIRAFWNVMLPLAKPGLVTVSIFNFIGIWNEYLYALVFINTDSFKTLPLGLASVSITAQYRSDFGLMFAGLVIVMIPTLIVYATLQERLTKGITVGALKG